jgi:hypothetical protein
VSTAPYAPSSYIKQTSFVSKSLISWLTELFSRYISFTVRTWVLSEVPMYRSEIAAKGMRFFSSPNRSDRHCSPFSFLYFWCRKEVKRPEHEADHHHLVARLRMCGGRVVVEVHEVLTGGLPNVENTKIYC